MRVFLCNRKFLGIPYYTKRHILFYRRFRPSTYVESIQISRFSPDFWRSKQAFCALGLTNFAELFSYNIPCRTERWEETVTYRVYADVILLQNLAADFLLLSVVKNCLRLPERRYGPRHMCHADDGIVGRNRACVAESKSVFPLIFLIV